MKLKTVVQIVLAAAIVGLALWLYSSIMKPVRFDNEYNVRRAACATKLKTIRTLEEAYKQTYGAYCGNFDTLVNRLLQEDSLLISHTVVNYDKIPEDVDIADVPEPEAIKKGYMTVVAMYVNPIAQLREQGKLSYTTEEGELHEISDQEIRDVRYVPYPKDQQYEFDLQAGAVDRGGLQVPVFECKVPLDKLLADMDHQDVINKIAELERINRYAGWKVGDMTQAVTDGNFE
ncbi:MAG: hypothetical protein IJV22_00560 [Bacteroidales bacterium]|nr:hypothetical protein [Bacteroidales bacterium]